jgi:hypothetical protein
MDIWNSVKQIAPAADSPYSVWPETTGKTRMRMTRARDFDGA